LIVQDTDCEKNWDFRTQKQTLLLFCPRCNPISEYFYSYNNLDWQAETGQYQHCMLAYKAMNKIYTIHRAAIKTRVHTFGGITVLRFKNSNTSCFIRLNHIN
jgi:hypothetical protein